MSGSMGGPAGVVAVSGADKVQRQDWATAHKQGVQQSQPGAGGAWLPGRVEAVPGRPTPAPAGPGAAVGADGGTGGATLSAGSQLGGQRPSSYGRGMSWPTSTAMTPTARTPADWMPNSFRVTNGGIARVSTSAPGSAGSGDPWFPSTLAGSDSAVNSNAVDEPNQQGLNSRSSLPGAAPRTAAASLATLVAALLALLAVDHARPGLLT